MFTIFYLSTCDTCRRIIKEWSPSEEVVMREVKSQPITHEELLRLKDKTGSFRELLNTRSRKLREWDVDWRSMNDDEIGDLILKDYSLLRRPILETPDRVFAGNSPAVVAEAGSMLRK